MIDGEALPYPDQLPEDKVVVVEPLASQKPMSPVVRRLLNHAIKKQAEQDYDSAASDLERALRIEPRNALLWARFAQVRYAQNRWNSAVQLAAKSNTLLVAQDPLRRQNWVLMGNAYEALGQTEKARKVRSKL